MWAIGRGGFNPCFNGLSYLTRRAAKAKAAQESFNPCFNGLSYLTAVQAEADGGHNVSTLVLMDCHI